MSDTLFDKFSNALDAYSDKFGDTPSFAGLPDDRLEKAIDVLGEAVQKDERLTDEQFLEAMGMEPLPEGALS